MSASVSISPEVAQALDAEAKALGVTRSQMVAILIVLWRSRLEFYTSLGAMLEDHEKRIKELEQPEPIE